MLWNLGLVSSWNNKFVICLSRQQEMAAQTGVCGGGVHSLDLFGTLPPTLSPSVLTTTLCYVRLPGDHRLDYCTRQPGVIIPLCSHGDKNQQWITQNTDLYIPSTWCQVADNNTDTDLYIPSTWCQVADNNTDTDLYIPSTWWHWSLHTLYMVSGRDHNTDTDLYIPSTWCQVETITQTLISTYPRHGVR